MAKKKQPSYCDRREAAWRQYKRNIPAAAFEGEHGWRIEAAFYQGWNRGYQDRLKYERQPSRSKV